MIARHILGTRSHRFKFSCTNHFFYAGRDPGIANSKLIFTNHPSDNHCFLKFITFCCNFTNDKAIIEGFRCTDQLPIRSLPYFCPTITSPIANFSKIHPPIAKGSSAENPKSLYWSMAGACRNRLTVRIAPHTDHIGIWFCRCKKSNMRLRD